MSMRGKSTESQVVQELLGRAAQGHAEAQERLLRVYMPHIERIVRGRLARLGHALRAREEAADLIQDVAMQLLRELPKHEWQGRGAFSGWIRRIADALLIDKQRYHAAQKRSPLQEEELGDVQVATANPRSPESALDGRRQSNRLLHLLWRLDEEQSAAVLMHHMGYSHAEIGETLGRTPEAARKLVARGRAKLLKLITDDAPAS